MRLFILMPIAPHMDPFIAVVASPSGQELFRMTRPNQAEHSELASHGFSVILRSIETAP